MLCAYYRLWADHIPKKIGFLYMNKKLKNKLSFDIKRFVILKELTPYKAMNFIMSDYPIYVTVT